MSFDSVPIGLELTCIIRQMSEHDYGDALWSVARSALCVPCLIAHRIRYPTPLSYFKRIQPGDVGYIRRGRFNLLFSAGSSGKRQLDTDVPRTFKPLDVGPITGFQRSPGHLLSSNIEEIEVRYQPSASTDPCVCSTVFISPGIPDVCFRILEPNSSILFRLAEDQGAVLMTKYPTYQEDIQLFGTFEKYTKVHYDSWVAFARKNGHGDDVKPILVTGVDMTRDFAMMTCPNNSEQKTVRFTTSAPGVGAVWGTWHSKVPIYTNTGPHPSRTPFSTQTMDPIIRHTDTAPDEYDQCVFVRYYTVRKRLWIPEVITAAAGPHDLSPGGYDDEGSPFEEQSTSGPGSDTVSGPSDDGERSESSATSANSDSDTVIHNTTLVRSSPSLCTYFRSLGTGPHRTKGTISM